MNRKTRRVAEARQRRDDQRWTAAFTRTAVGRIMLAAHESLTDKDKEDWLLIVDGDDLYLTALREYGGMTHMRYVVTTVSGLKAGGSKGTIETETGLGCVTVVLPTDAEERGALDVLAWLSGIAARSKAFNIMTISGEVPTAEAVSAWQESGLRQSLAAGEA
jgi:hypothetical protein